MKHVEAAFIPMKTPKKGKPYFAVRCLDWSANGAREQFCGGAIDPPHHWKESKKDGWRIVKVRVST
jgi:hypothetical protein